MSKVVNLKHIGIKDYFVINPYEVTNTTIYIKYFVICKVNYVYES
jgi:hypothetical protein